MRRKNKKLLFFISVDWYFWSHRLQLALDAKKIGYEVAVVTNTTHCTKKIEAQGIVVYHLPGFKRNVLGLISNFIIMANIISVIQSFKPTVIHNIALKQVLIGTLVALMFSNIRVVNTIAGFGILRVSNKLFFKLIFNFLLKIFSLFTNFSNVHFILQNQSDLNLLSHQMFTNKSKLQLIKGSGVELQKPKKYSTAEKFPTFLFASRLIEEKGILQYVEAANRLNKLQVQARFLVAGLIDKESPNPILAETLENSAVEWIGFSDDVNSLIDKCRAVCLFSSYGEGVPRILLESLARSTPIITTNAPGCEELVDSGRNGILISATDMDEIEKAFLKLIHSPSHAFELGKSGRQYIEKEYCIRNINDSVLEIYEQH